MNGFPSNQSHYRRWLFYCLIVLLAGLYGCAAAKESVDLTGTTMGTTWHVSFLGDTAQGIGVQANIEQLLQRVNDSMSTYLAHSEITRFNNLAQDKPFDMSADFTTVLDAALQIGLASRGVYDVTVGPLVNLWGFGPEPGGDDVPDSAAISALLKRIGQDKLSFNSTSQTLIKTEDLVLDFSSIAKGYAVDLIAESLIAQGIANFLVEVGGEVRVAGQNTRGTRWRIAVERPDGLIGDVAAALSITNRGIATSGDYRNYFEKDGRRYSHTLDPRTGYPIKHNLVSVTVVHDSAMMADGWATALMVLGAEEGMEVALAHNLAVYFIQRTEDNYQATRSPTFAQYLESVWEN